MSKLESFLHGSTTCPVFFNSYGKPRNLGPSRDASPDNPECFTGTHCRSHADICEQYHRSGNAVGYSPVAGGTHPVSSIRSCHNCGPDSEQYYLVGSGSQSELVRDYITGIVQAHAVQLDMTYYEQNEYYDLIHRVRQQATDRPLMLLEGTGSLVQSILSMIGLAALLIAYGIWLLPLLVISALPALWGLIWFNRRINHWRKESTFVSDLASITIYF